MTTTSLSPGAISSLLAGPAATPPPGVTPNFVDPPSLHTANYACLIITWVLATIAVAMRLFTRWHVVKVWTIEDLFILIGWMFFIAYGSICFLCIDNGVGIDQWNQTLATFLIGSKYVNIAAIVYAPAIVFIKLAILFQFLRLFAPRRKMNPLIFYPCWLFIILLPIVYTIDTILTIIQCTPREKIWNPFVPGRCLNASKAFTAGALFNVITDILILVMPLSAILKLQMKTDRKLRMAALFTIGVFACVASILRTYYSYVTVRDTTNLSWYFALQGITTWWELSMGILVFCLPVTPRFYLFCKKKYNSSPLGRHETTDLGPAQPPQEPERLTWADRIFGQPDDEELPMESLGISMVRKYESPRQVLESSSYLEDSAHCSDPQKGSVALVEERSTATSESSGTRGPAEESQPSTQGG